MNKKNILHIFFLFISFHNGIAQVTFVKKYSQGNINDKQPIVQTLDGGYAFSNYSAYSPDSGSYINKVSAEGNLIWSKIFPLGGWKRVTSLVQTFNGHIVAGGSIDDTSQIFDPNFFLFETDTSGNMIWAKAYGDTTIVEQAGCMQKTIDGGYILAGGIGGLCLVIKTNSIGDTIWTRMYTDSIHLMDCHFIEQTLDSCYILCGNKEKGCYIMKIDSAGQVLWIKSFSNDYHGVYGNFPYEIHQTNDSGFILGGFRDTIGGGDVEIFLIRTDKFGDTLWTKVLNSPDRDILYSVIQSSDGGFIFTGYIYNPSQISYIGKLDFNGDTLWMKSNSIYDWSEGYCIISTSDGGYLFTGSSGELGGAMLASFIIKTDSSGNSGCNQDYISLNTSTLQTTISIPTIYSEYASIEVTNINVQTSAFNILDSTFCSSVSVNEIDKNVYLSISPNPASTSFTINSNQIQNSAIEIYNLIGEKIFSANYREQLTVNCELFPKGIYLVRLQSEKGGAMQKLIIQ